MSTHNISGRRCIIDSCRISRRRNPNAKLFEFPYKDEVLLESWLEVCELDKSILGKHLYICDKHFALKDFGKRKCRLKKNVIPTKYLKNNLDEDSPRRIQTQTKLTLKSKLYDKRKSGRHCVICNITRRSNPFIRLFTFPRDPERFQKWVKICKLKPSDLQVKRVIICEKHFLKTDLKGRRFTENAEPRFFLSNIPSITEKPKIIEKDNSINCLIKHCNSKNSTEKLLTFPKEATNLFNIWSDIFHINKEEIFNIKLSKLSDDHLYICEKHFITSERRPEIFKEIKNKVVEKNNDENEIELNNIKLEFVSATDDPLENLCVIKEENIYRVNDKIRSESNELNYIEKAKNVKKLLLHQENFFKRKIKKMRNKFISERNTHFRNIHKLINEIKILKNS